jgi:hypothetical protein
VTDHQQRAAEVLDAWSVGFDEDLPPESLTRTVAAALEQAAAEARADVVRAVEALAETLDLEAHDDDATRAVTKWETADRIRAVLAAAVAPEGGNR